MTVMKRKTILPILGLKSNVAQDDRDLFVPVDRYGNILATYCVDGVNIDFQRTRKSCSKAYGKTKWAAATQIGSGGNVQGIFELYDGSNRDHVVFQDGKVYIYDSSWAPQDRSGAVTFATGPMDFFTAIRYGSYMIFTDYGEHTPYKWVHGDAAVSKLISSGTEYKFRYLTMFQGRILGLHNPDESNGDVIVRWTDLLPSIASGTSFTSTNALYKPGNDAIVGVKPLGNNALIVYGEESICRLDYYASYSTPFGFTTIINGDGITNHHSIVSAMGSHYVFNKNYGFCQFNGTSEFPYGGRPISEDIEDKIASISTQYYGHLYGKFIPNRNEIVWAVPLSSSSVPTHLLYYHVLDKTWRVEDKDERMMDNWVIYTDLTWSDLITILQGAGYATPTWAQLVTYLGAKAKWLELVTHSTEMVIMDTDGYVYYLGGDSDNGSDLDGYRIEPIMDFGNPHEMDYLSEIWFKLSQYGSYYIDVSYRCGDTEAEVMRQSWTSLGTVSCESPEKAVLYCDRMARLHQIKWGTDKADEAFAVNAIEFGYIPQARY